MMKDLKSTEALTKGASLWITPYLNQSEWTPYIDWLTGFQLTENKELKTPLLILTEKMLPNEKTVMLHFTEDKKEFLEKLDGIWTDLKKPSLRIFLPFFLQKEDLLSYFKEENESIQMVSSKREVL